MNIDATAASKISIALRRLASIDEDLGVSLQGTLIYDQDSGDCLGIVDKEDGVYLLRIDG